ncbi:hypothetical protein RSAG8_04898, partial [Rhizoctonia solani AG-8 WAC10335]
MAKKIINKVILLSIGMSYR